jgi:large subunit ribosomal protein L36e
MTELCRSTNCEPDDIEQQHDEHTGRIFSGTSYTTAGAQVGILELPNVASDSYTFESRGAGHGLDYRSGILKTVEVDVASQRG